jgi:hypothetical protein
MEIAEIVSYYIYEDNNTFEVSFRLSIDNDDDIRVDIIEIDDFTNYGYTVINESSELYFSEFDEDDFDDYNDFLDVDEESLLNFLNEYYIVNPNKLPKTNFI